MDFLTTDTMDTMDMGTATVMDMDTDTVDTLAMPTIPTMAMDGDDDDETRT